VASDIAVTLLHPTARGPLSYAANRLTWSVVRTASIRLLGGRGLSYAGPLAVVTNLFGWVLTLWVGYALVYLPLIHRFSYDPATPFKGKGLAEALYVSGSAMTTVGFGDVVPTGAVLRLVTLSESAAGFGVLSAATAFVLALYPLITKLRSTGLQLADVGALEPAGAARFVGRAGPSELGVLLREMTENHESVRRFPVLYYFESGNPEESLTALVRGSALLLVALRCGPSGEEGHAPLYADALERSLTRLLEDLERDFLGWRRGSGPDVAPAGDAGDRLATLCRALGGDDGQEGSQEAVAEELGELLARADAGLAAVAHEHGHDPKPILPKD
jgi:hypothetical protein